MPKIKTTNSTSLRKNLQAIGDDITNTFNKTGDLKAAEKALQAYRDAVNVSKAQLVYKKLTGKPGVIDFFED